MAWVTWFFVSLFYAYQYLLRVLPNIIMPDLIKEFDVDATQIGNFSGIYYIGYTAMHIPMGILIDKFGAKKVIPISILLTVVGMLPLIFADHWYYLLLGRLMIGIGSSASVLGAFKIIRMGFGPEKFSRVLGFTVTLGLLGAIYGGGPLAYFVDTFSWQVTIYMFVIFGVILALLTYITIPRYDLEEGTNIKDIYRDVLKVLSNYKVIGLSFIGGLMVGPMEGFADAWATQFLRSAYMLDRQTAGTLPSLIFLGMCFGCSALGYLAEKTKAYYGLIFLCAVGMGTTFAYILLNTVSIMVLNIIFFLIGVMCAYQLLIISKVSSFVSERLVSMASACVNMIIMIFGYIFHTFIGGVISIYGEGIELGGDIVYDAESYTYALSIIPITLSLAAVLMLFLMLRRRYRVRLSATSQA